jgi:uncharacterized protein GlcG (DUF336 family)
MASLSLKAAQHIISTTVEYARDHKLKPMSVVVLDARGELKAAICEDGTSLRRFAVAHGKAHGALALGMGSRSIAARAKTMAPFIAATSHLVGPLVPVPGGILVSDAEGQLIGAVGVSGDSSDNDEAAALAGIKSAGLIPDAGAD